MEMSSSTPVQVTTFGLLRHGQTEWNILKRVQGSADSPLTQEGRLQSAEWGKTLLQLGWHRIICSDLGRVKETVAILNQSLQLPVAYDPRLREQHWGDWEGMTIPHITKHFHKELTRQVALGWDFTAPGGESRGAVRDRLFGALSEAAIQWPEQRILVVCHQGVIKSALYHLTQREFLPGEDPLLQHNRLHLIRCANGTFSPVKLNIPRLAEP
ncbi:MAG: histidine phosphatase family protein [Desulforhopalus sp.]